MRRILILTVLCALLLAVVAVPAYATSLDTVSFPDSQHGWVGSQEGLVLATENGGETWYRQFTPENPRVLDLDFVDGQYGWLASSFGPAGAIGVFATTDGGITWVRQLHSSVDRIDFADRKNGWAVGTEGCFRTRDGGATWVRQYPSTGTLWYSSVACVDGNTAWVGTVSTRNTYEYQHIFRTTDGGATWLEMSIGPVVPGSGFWAINDLHFHDRFTGWATSAGVMRTDSGAASSWTRQMDWDVHSLDFSDKNHGAATGERDWVAVTNNGGWAWAKSYPGAAPSGDSGPYEQYLDVARSREDHIWAVGNADHDNSWEPVVVHSDDGGATWGHRFVDRGIVEHVGGKTRYHTAVAISQPVFTSAETVILATGRAYPDALAASGLSGALDAPLLLTDPSSLPGFVVEEIERLGASKIIIVGGTGAVSAGIQSELAKKYDVTRIGGVNRYETAALIAKRIAEETGGSPTAFVARGDEFADALSVAPYAASQEMPVLLVRPNSVPAATASALESLGVTETLVLGGTGAVSDSVMSSLGEIPGIEIVDRVAAGHDRYSTCAELIDYAEAEGWITDWKLAGFATGANFPDGLAGGAALGHRGRALFLTRPGSLPPSIADRLENHSDTIEWVWVFGDRNGAVGDPAANMIARILAY